MTADNVDFIGRGWMFPVRVSKRGGLMLTSGVEEINASLRMILSTAPGERVMRPDFGCRIWDLLFAPVDANTLGQMVQTVTEAVERWEPRIELQEVEPVPDPEDASVVHILLTYVLKNTNDRRNLVFPFYTIPREDSS
ncbi:MAG: GPW/gp25 family protein [Dehalococcoidia bacterium]